MDPNMMWGIYWTVAWFFAVSTFFNTIEEWSIGNMFMAFLTACVTTAVMFGVGAKILNYFIG